MAQGAILTLCRLAEAAALILNAAGLTFASVLIMDALTMFPGPAIELHITNIHRRAAVHHPSLVSKGATAVVAGPGAGGHRAAVEAA